MTFKTAISRLTLFYVLVVMIISLAFSMILYRISSAELSRSLGRQTRFFRDLPRDEILPFPLQQLEDARTNALEESSHHIILNLVYFNLLILALSSVGGYLMAKRTLKPIEEMVEAQNRFTADASHELRTPLTAMRTEIEVSLRDKKLGLDDAKQLLASNLEEILKIETLANALLKLAGYDQDVQHAFQSVTLREVVGEAYEKVHSLAEAKSIIFKNDFTDWQVMGDRQSLIELFVILLDNAIKYSPKNSMVSVTAEQGDGQVIVKVTDHGMGIKASDILHIFDRFFRADQSRAKESVPGYGLGLSIAKRIVVLHRGTITVKSQLGKGSDFTAALPKA